MKANRKFIIAGAGASGLLAIFLIATSGSAPEPPSMDAPAPVAAPAPQMEMEGVLVAQNEIPLGTLISEKDLVWVQWPRQFAGPGSIRMSEDPNAIQTLKGGIARQAFFHGEPIRREKIVKTGTSGFLSAILPAGSRAMAINIDASGSMTAGGFILPNDRVDILRVVSGADGGDTETILTNIRVLAIGQNIEEKNGERVVTGSNATLELTPSQAEIVAAAQRGGQLTLALRSMLDMNKKAETASADSNDRSLTIIRNGASTTMIRR
jgi:pilus assembly protein CpaB